MNTRSSARPSSVWAAFWLQIAVTATSWYGSVQILALWSRYPTIGAQAVVRNFGSAAIAAVSLIGLWKGRSWGWILALAIDCIMCAETLWVMLNHPAVVSRSPRFLAFNIWEFAAVATLLHPPVRQHFFKGRTHDTTLPLIAAQSRVSAPREWIRIITYLAVAAVGTCAVTAFALALFMGQKNGGARGFLVLFYFGITTGGVASLLFVSILTAVGRQFGSTRLWVWLLFGGLLAPCLIVMLGLVGQYLGAGAPGVVFWGPSAIMHMQVWWLTPVVGVVIGWFCYVIYPWAHPNCGNPR